MTAFTESECFELFNEMFPHGAAGDDVMAEVAPQGWLASPLKLCSHPTAEPHPASVEPQRELRELVGRCLWDIFSDNHEVIAPNGRLVDLGSFRGSASFIADYFNREIGQSRYGYMDFFMGTSWWPQRAEPSPVYIMIFGRLRQAGCDWRYVFPRISMVNLQPLRDALDAVKKPDWQDYDPSAALAKEQQRQEQEEQRKEMQESLDAMNRDLEDTISTSPPPATVIAYQTVFGRFPAGWPQK